MEIPTCKPAPPDDREPIGIGLLGYGFMSKTHTNALRTIPYIFWPSAGRPELVAIAGHNEAALPEASTRYGYREYSTDWCDVVSDERVEVFDNAGPDAVHVEPTLAAIAHGKHVVCEKPLALTAADAARVYEARAGRSIASGCCG